MRGPASCTGSEKEFLEVLMAKPCFFASKIGSLQLVKGETCCFQCVARDSPFHVTSPRHGSRNYEARSRFTKTAPAACNASSDPAPASRSLR